MTVTLDNTFGALFIGILVSSMCVHPVHTTGRNSD